MPNAPVSEEVMLFVADFLIDELSQNLVTAADTKQRVREHVHHLLELDI